MNINSITPYSTNFQARIKIDKPKLEVLAQTAIGIAATAAGAASIADGALSANTVFGDANLIDSIPKEVVDSHKEYLKSAGHRYDAAGVVRGVPVQSTVAPTIMSGGGSYSSYAGSNAFRNAVGDDNLKATSMIPSDASNAISVNKSALNSSIGAGLLGTIAANIYSAANIDSVNDMAPESLQFGNKDLEKLQILSLLSAGGEIAVPSVYGAFVSSDKLSETKSSQFVADTLNAPNSSRKIPS